LVIQWETDMLALSGISKIKDMLIVNFQFFIHAIGYGILQLCVYAIVVISYAMYFVSFAAFRLILAVGPFFLFTLSFPFTQRFFETWIGAAITAALAMAFTAFMTVFCATMLGIKPLNDATTTITFADFGFVSTMLAKAAFAALGIYLYFKIFDLASSLGGGLNMGNNMAGAVRSLANDLRRGGPGSGGGRNTSTQNTVNAGGAGRSGAERTRESNRQYQTMTGAAIAAGGRGAALGARGAVAGGRLAYQRGIRPVAAAAGQAAARGTVAVGRAAYVGGSAVVRAARNLASRGIPGITS
jgi:type IV secretory pathway VirB6-like protein